MNLASVLQVGTRFRLLKPHDFYGKAVLAGEYTGKEIEVPVEEEFAAYVLTKERSAGITFIADSPRLDFPARTGSNRLIHYG